MREVKVFKIEREFNKDTQNWKILKRIYRNGSITAMEAAYMGITQFHARIYELQADGYVFTRTKVIPADNGNKWYNEYSLDKGQ